MNFKIGTLTDEAIIHKNRRPSGMVLWLVARIAFSHNEPIAEVTRRLNVCTERLTYEKLLEKTSKADLAK